jgi:pilus assembly protein CpaB
MRSSPHTAEARHAGDRRSVKVVQWPATRPGAFTKVEDVVNRGLIATVDEERAADGTKLAPTGGSAASIPPGMRAISVKVNEVVGVADSWFRARASTSW